VRTAVLLTLLCCSCRVEPVGPSPDTDSANPPASSTIDLGQVPVGATLVHHLLLGDRVDTNADLVLEEAELSLSLLEDPVGVEVSWTPDATGEGGAAVVLPDGARLELVAEAGDALSLWPAPIATEIGIEALSPLPETGLGAADLSGSGPVSIVEDPVNGHTFVAEPEARRVWRLDPFYRHPSWGIWVATTKEDKERWGTAPPCFLDANGLTQDGTCTGDERDDDGEVPDGWRYYHGGFAEDLGLAGISAMVADEARGRIWVLGEGRARALDADVNLTGEERGDPYVYTQFLPGLRIDLGGDFARPWATLMGTDLLLVGLDSGSVSALDPGSGTLTALSSLPGPLDAVTHDGSDLITIAGDTLRWHDVASGDTLVEQALPAGALSAADRGQAQDGRAWFAWGGRLAVTTHESLHLVAAPDGGTITDVVFDEISGGDAAPLARLYVLGETDGTGWLRAATPDGAWQGDAITLPTPARALGQGRTAHDLHVIYGASSAGCDAELAAWCTDGEHPALIQSFYEPYGLVPPTSTGEPLNLFLYPIVETPKDADIDVDFTADSACGGEDGRDAGCCALAWSLEQRVAPNQAYLTEVLGTVGDDTSSTDDDPAFAWGINPSFLRQARLCLDSEEPEHQEAGRAAYLAVAGLVADRHELTHWTHTAAALGLGESENHRWYLSLLYEDGVDFELPLDGPDEYAMLHEGISAVFQTDDLDDPDLAALDLWSPLTSGNSLDAEELTDPDVGWPDQDPSWVVPVRDGPLAVGQPPREAYSFLSLGTDPEVGSATWRKKELWPTDLRVRTELMWLNEDALSFGVADPASQFVNIPGMSWELGTLRTMSEAGAYRETLKYGQTVLDDNWENVHRMLRRLIASSEPDVVKGWYQHIFDVSHRNGIFTENSGVTADRDRNLVALERIDEELVAPGFARWSTPSELIARWEAAEAE